jgi:hypothetical protein
MYAIMPWVFKGMAYFEDYENGSNEVKIEIARTFVVRIIGIYAILFGYISGGQISVDQQPPFPVISVGNEYSDPVGNYTMDQAHCVGTVPGFRWNVALEDAIGSPHMFA